MTVRLPGMAVKYRCLGPCDEIYPTYQHLINHRRGQYRDCKGQGWDIEFPEALVQEVIESAPPPPPQEPAAETEEAAAETEPAAAEEAADKDPDRGLKVEARPSPAGDGRAPPPPFQVVEPSTTKENVWVPAAARTLYDTIRADERFRFEGSFNDFIVESFFEYWSMLGVKVAVIVSEPEIRADGTLKQEETAHAQR